LKLVDNFYPEDFNEKKMHYLRSQLKYYQINLIYYKSFQHMSIIFKLCRGLMKTNKLQHNHLINKLITLHVFSTATKKWAFLAMKHVKNIFHNKIKNEFLAYFIMIYIEQKLVEDIYLDSIIDEFYSTKHRRVQF
jgi:hypothetical protein